ncbi:tripartite motif-containing protein [Anaeramoeba flamelloides]|uniref:Tripartite motif-containing protein n=1 Tax=Anaeramoeba flamelloides TaxID=1746091 RepID=A0ABQ8YZX6_9EUKA|nr:tripartite motif-containing protein [Anaeramoeba flamelloides]
MTINHPIQAKDENSEEEEIIWCDVCLQDDRKLEAISYCQDYSDNNRTENCPIHQNLTLSRYCKNCQKLICEKCSLDHTNHETISFDQPMDFYQELINEQKKCTQNHFEKINENLEQLNNTEKKIKTNKKKIVTEISEFYLNQKKLLDLLEQKEIKLANDFFEQISKKFNTKAEIVKSFTNERITEISKFQEGTKLELIGERLFQEVGEYQINISINDQKIPKSPFKLKVINDFFLKESEILQRENYRKFNQILEKWIKEAGCNSNLQRRFNSRTNRWKYQTFHKLCDNKRKSIVLIKF